MSENLPELKGVVEETGAILRGEKETDDQLLVDRSDGSSDGQAGPYEYLTSHEMREFQLGIEESMLPMWNMIAQAADAEVALGLKYEPMAMREKMQDVLALMTQLQSMAKSYGRYDGGKRDLPAANLFTALGIGLAVDKDSLITAQLESDGHDNFYDVVTLKTDAQVEQELPGLSVPSPLVSDRVTPVLHAQDRLQEVDRPSHNRPYYHDTDEWRSHSDEAEEHFEPGCKQMMLVYHQELLRTAQLMGVRNLHNMVDLVFQHEVSESQDPDVDPKDRYPEWHRVHVLIDQLEPYLAKMKLGMRIDEAAQELMLKRTAGERWSGLVKKLTNEGAPSLSEKVKRMFRHIFRDE
jgi:hypothetical protein